MVYTQSDWKKFSNCIFTEDFVVKRISTFNSDLEDFFVGKTSNEKKGKTLVIASMAITKLLPENSPCFSDSSKCAAEIGKATSDKEKFAKQREKFYPAQFKTSLYERVAVLFCFKLLICGIRKGEKLDAYS